MARVPCDPAQVIVNHASFRVELGSPAPSAAETAVLPPLPSRPVGNRGSGGAQPRAVRRPVVWTGRVADGDPGAGSLLQAVRERGAGSDGVSTQVLPRITDTTVLPVPSVVAPRGPDPGESRPATRPPSSHPLPEEEYARGGGLESAPYRDGYDTGGYDAYDGGRDIEDEPDDGPATLISRTRADGRSGFYPHRNLNLGIVLLPLRLLLGFIVVTAGFAKLTDPVYFDGGERGSMVTWLGSLEPWAMAQPLHSWALAHPVGAGLTVAFIQIIVGVLTIAGLWQRMAAVLGALLSLALLVTVAWQSGPAYDAPDIILLAAWSPLILAGAPVYSLDARISGEAWRTLGPRVPVRELRRRVRRRSALLAMLLLGVTLLIGSLLGGAVRSAELTPEPRPGDLPRNSQDGRPLPSESADPEDEDGQGPGAENGSGLPGEEPGEGDTAETSGAGDPEGPGGEGGGPAPEQTVPAEGGVGGGATGGEPQPQQPPAPGGQQQPDEAPQPGGGGEPAAPPPSAEGGSDQPPAEETTPSDDGGEESSPGPIGGLLG